MQYFRNIITPGYRHYRHYRIYAIDWTNWPHRIFKSALLVSLMTIGPVLAVGADPLPGSATPLRVARWWNSESGQKGADVLKARLAQDNLQWTDVQLPVGVAGADLKSRALNGTAPNLAALKGKHIAEWANLGLLTEFKPAKPRSANDPAKWDSRLVPGIADLVRPNGHLVAIPLGIHRVNTLFYNKVIFKQYGLSAPTTWEEFTKAANQLSAQGVIPLAQSSDPAQIAGLFENLLLSEGSADLYRKALIERDSNAFNDTRTTRALLRLRILKKFMPNPVTPQSWSDVIKSVAKGNAAMAIMGDFAKGELNAAGFTTDVNFGCLPVPGTAHYHLYDVDSLVVLANTGLPAGVADQIALALTSSNVQADYSVVTGAIPVLKNPDQMKMDSYAQESFKLFAQGSSVQVPSIIAGMGGDSAYRDALIAELNRYFSDNSISVNEVQSHLARLARQLPRP